jgi:predicted ribosome quality control (RQC) complex YloA/Tae2 family protein
MRSRQEIRPAALTDADLGTWRGRSVARPFRSPDGLVVLVGRSAADNDVLTFKLAAPHDFWLHAAGTSGAHVIVRNPERLQRLPRDTLRFAAALAVAHSGHRRAGRAAVHVTTCVEVEKPRRLTVGTVSLRRYRTVHAAAADVSSPAPDDRG